MNPSTSQASSGADFDLSQFYQVFFEEANENLGSMESLLLELDPAAPDDEQMNAIFRCAHSIKGGAATFGFQDVADLTHVMETLLDRLRRHELALQPGMIDVLLESGDALRGLLARHQGVSEDVIDASELVARIGAHANGQGAGPVRAVVAPAASRESAGASPAVSGVDAASVASTASASTAEAAMSAGAATDGMRLLEITVGAPAEPRAAAGLIELFNEIPGLGAIEPVPSGDEVPGRFRVRTVSSDDELLDLFTFHVAREAVTLRVCDPASGEADPGFGFFEPLPGAAGVPAAQAAGVAAAQTVAPSAANTTEASSAASAATAASAAAEPRAAARARNDKGNVDASTLRVSVDKVDQLINLVGELVITQAMLAQTGRDLDPIAHQQLMSCLVDLERNTRSLQESVMAIRMIPMAVVFNRFPRMIRDLAARLGKNVELHTVGEATELDKGMIEKITDPLTHLVRNAVDHGIETPEERLAAGKPAQGSLTLSAQHRGGSIIIEVRDDGRGLKRDRILAKARERGLPVSDSMTDQEVFNLIFEPGFSTADAVTDVSGRGVGMDVVRKNIMALGGSVELDAAVGYGTRVSVRLPLTLAIMDGMSVGVSEETYIVPIASVVESIQLDTAQIRSVAGSNKVIQVRDEYLPVLALDELFKVPRFDDKHQQSAILVVVEAEGMRVALLVDQLLGQHQVVVKNLEANYRKVPGVAGATILGDGRVALILDISNLVRRSRN
ncbi:MAG: chemotaxis protein CheW [Burkholderiaceae bacterium]